MIDHPNADRLSLVRIKGFTAIANKHENGDHRYSEGDYVAYLPEASVLPEWLLRHLGFWDDAENKGKLAGVGGGRVKPLKLRKIFSEGLLIPVEFNHSMHCCDYSIVVEHGRHVIAIGALDTEHEGSCPDPEGIDVADLLGITKWVPPIPMHLAGEVTNIHGKTKRYDFENWKNIPDVFEDGREVVATEKLHGTCFLAGYWHGLGHPEMFGNGDIFVGSKGLSAQGLVFKNNVANDGNVYVRKMRRLLDDKAFYEGIIGLSRQANDAPVYVFGEIFGKGVQDLTYGFDKPEFRVFDISVGDNFLAYDDFVLAAACLGLETVPLLYRGPFGETVLKEFVDGKTTFGEACIREGIVIRAVDGGSHDIHGRMIAKMVSEDYLLRKAKKGEEGPTEFN